MHVEYCIQKIIRGLKPTIEVILFKEQQSFGVKRSCIENILILQQYVENHGIQQRNNIFFINYIN